MADFYVLKMSVLLPVKETFCSLSLYITYHFEARTQADSVIALKTWLGTRGLISVLLVFFQQGAVSHSTMRTVQNPQT